MQIFICVLLVFFIPQELCASSGRPIGSIDSVMEIPQELFGPGTLLAVDADETVAQVTVMAKNFEWGRQHKDVMSAAAVAAARLTLNELPPLLSTTDADILQLPQFQEAKKTADQVLDAFPRAYNFTEAAWPSFLQTVRKTGTKVIIVSSRRFFDRENHTPAEPARIDFFKILGFLEVDLLYSGSVDGYQKDRTIARWLAVRPPESESISRVIFVDNLYAHCQEIVSSTVLPSDRYAFVHNAFANYITRHQGVLIQQMCAAAQGRVLTDAEIMLQMNNSAHVPK